MRHQQWKVSGRVKDVDRETGQSHSNQQDEPMSVHLVSVGNNVTRNDNILMEIKIGQ